jgi:quercetin dioxygenase-like cupin family protein
MICDIENGAKSPTIAVLSALAESLGARLSDMVAEADVASSAVAVRRKRSSGKIVDAQGIERRQLVPDVTGGRSEIIQLTIPSRKATGALAPHAAGTIEYVHLAQGSLQVRVGNRGYQLKAGDSIGFRADVRHAYANTGSTRALLYVVVEHTN